MPSFQSLFLKSKGQPFIYNGNKIQLVDRLVVDDGQQVNISFDSVNSEWRQGVCLTTDGGFWVNGRFCTKSIVLWQDTAPAEVVLTIGTKKSECQVKNVWDVGDGAMHSWHNGAAMIVEESDHRRRYRCNDGKPNDDFDDLIFSIDLIR